MPGGRGLLSQLHQPEVIGLIVLTVIIVVLAVWLLSSHWRRFERRMERFDWRHSQDHLLPGDDWRFGIPPEFRTEETGRLFTEKFDVVR